MDILNSYWIK